MTESVALQAQEDKKPTSMLSGNKLLTAKDAQKKLALEWLMEITLPLPGSL